MKSDNSLLITVFCLILFGILAIYGLILYRVTEIENFLKIHEGVNVTDEFKFMVDFADRNIEIFIWYSTLLFTVVTILVGLAFKYQFNREVGIVNNKFTSFSKEQIERNDDMAHKVKVLSMNLSLESGYNLITFSKVIEHENIAESVYMKFKSLEAYLRSIESGMRSTDGFNLQMKNIINEIKILIPQMKLSHGQQVVLQPDFKKSLQQIPDNLFEELNEVIAMYNLRIGGQYQITV